MVYLCGDKAKPAKAAETEKEGCKAAASSAKAEAAAVRACYWSTVGVFAV